MHDRRVRQPSLHGVVCMYNSLLPPPGLPSHARKTDLSSRIVHASLPPRALLAPPATPSRLATPAQPPARHPSPHGIAIFTPPCDAPRVPPALAFFFSPSSCAAVADSSTRPHHSRRPRSCCSSAPIPLGTGPPFPLPHHSGTSPHANQNLLPHFPPLPHTPPPPSPHFLHPHPHLHLPLDPCAKFHPDPSTPQPALLAAASPPLLPTQVTARTPLPPLQGPPPEHPTRSMFIARDHPLGGTVDSERFTFPPLPHSTSPCTHCLKPALAGLFARAPSDPDPSPWPSHSAAPSPSLKPAASPPATSLGSPTAPVPHDSDTLATLPTPARPSTRPCQLAYAHDPVTRSALDFRLLLHAPASRPAPRHTRITCPPSPLPPCSTAGRLRGCSAGPAPW